MVAVRAKAESIAARYGFDRQAARLPIAVREQRRTRDPLPEATVAIVFASARLAIAPSPWSVRTFRMWGIVASKAHQLAALC